MNHLRNAFRLNVGFIVNLSVGTSREFLFEYPSLHLPPDLDISNLYGTARVTRTPQGLLTQVKMRALIGTECVRCLTELQQSLAIDFTELYAFSSRTASDTDLILPEDGHIDLAPLVREYMLLDIPINPVCTPGCQGLCLVCGENLNEFPHDHGDEPIDPRFSVLKELLE